MRTSKHFFTFMFAVAMLLVSVISVSAANNTDRDFEILVSGNRYTAIPTTQSKTDTSAVYLYLDEGEYFSHVFVQACGCNAGSTNYVNKTSVFGTLVESVVCRTNVKYSIHSYIYESGFRNATLQFMHIGYNFAENVSGKWSPDSVGTYTYAT